MIERADVDRIMDAVNIVDVVSEFVTLRRSGVNFKGLCPFHDDKTPSFIVSPSKGICHCFACGKGGNAVNFLMEHEQLSYPDALRWLARKYNIEIHERQFSDEEQQQASQRESMFIVNEWASKYFQDVLHHTPDGQALGMQYLRSRGFRDDIISKFHIGYAPAKRDSLAREAKSKGYKEDFLVATGLCYRRDDGSLTDRYSGRIIFPWLNISGKVNAFGGRLLDSRTKGVQQKYVNSPESDIFHKDHELFGLYQAKKSIAKEDNVYMVEGYTDVISMHQGGIENVVANSGTALSLHQIRMLRRFSQNITLLYDGDEAGIHAAMRGTDMLLSEGMNVRVVILPDDDDPDSYSRKHTAQEFRDYVERNRKDFIGFKTDLTLKGVSDPVRRSEAISGIVRSISLVPNQITRDTYLHDLASMLGMSERSLINTMNGFIRGDVENRIKEAEREKRRAENSSPTAETPKKSPGVSHLSLSPLEKVELELVRLIMKHGEEILLEDMETTDGEHISLNLAQYIDYNLFKDELSFSSPLFIRILSEALEQSDMGDFKAEPFFTSHADMEISRLASELVVERHRLSRSMQMELRRESLKAKVDHFLLDLRREVVEQRLSRLQADMKTAAGDMETMRVLMEEFRKVGKIRNDLAKGTGKDVSIRG